MAPPETLAAMLWSPGWVDALGEYVAVVLPVLAIVPTEALPFSTPSTNHESVPVPPDSVALNACGCDVVTAERRGESATVTLEVGGGFGVGEEFPPPQEVNPGETRAAARTSIRVRRLLQGSSQKTAGNDSIHVLRWQWYGMSTAGFMPGDEAYRACPRNRTSAVPGDQPGKTCEDIFSVQGELATQATIRGL